MRYRLLAAVSLTTLIAAPVWAQNPPELAAEQVRIDFNSSTYVGVINNSPVQKFAQSFRLYQEGPISHVMLPLLCNNSQPLARVFVSIQTLRNGLPNGRNLVRQEVPWYVLDAYPDASGVVGMRMVEFTGNWTLTPGDYALVIEATDGDCGIWYGPSGDTYVNGEAFYYAPLVTPFNSPPWRAWGRDLAFQVFQRPL